MTKLHKVPAAFAAKARIKHDDYQRLYKESIEDPEGFWGRMGQRVDWLKPYTDVKDVSFNLDDFRIRWYPDGQLNVSVNCLDRQLARRGDKTAILWEGDDPGESVHITYRELYERVCQLANALRSLGVTKGDRVTIYLPMIPEAAVAMLACARIGAIHSVVFGGFSPDSLAGRIADCASNLVITADEGLRGGKRVPLKANVDKALSAEGTETVQHVLVVRRTGSPVAMYGRDKWYSDVVDGQPKECEPEVIDAEDPLFILYTSGSTGKPKGVLHTSGGYLVYASLTHECVFDLQEDDIFWCT
ncbi:MAG TPA: AMP-binding protein, partial [Steroidobacteraceae bacterium]|nr:AMP-binding protein [Steroidobacteraceae bacterium]